jgi:hypothetical protein
MGRSVKDKAKERTAMTRGQRMKEINTQTCNKKDREKIKDQQRLNIGSMNDLQASTCSGATCRTSIKNVNVGGRSNTYCVFDSAPPIGVAFPPPPTCLIPIEELESGRSQKSANTHTHWKCAACKRWLEYCSGWKQKRHHGKYEWMCPICAPHL